MAFAKLVKLAVKAEREHDLYFDFNYDVPSERANKFAFNPVTKEWTEEIIIVKIEPNAFAKGAQRSAHRMKIYDGYDWHKSPKWVAKKYLHKPEHGRKSFEDDVILQATAKHYGDQYNLLHPPKSVDFMICYLIEMIDRPDKDLYCIEAFIEGDYMKHSNNAGFIDVERWRNTPHAFSHFTFVRSNQTLLVCDIQGVNDLYTDPQLHAIDGESFGAGNLGLRGMALFLYSHECNFICKKLRLPPFELFPEDHHHDQFRPGALHCEFVPDYDKIYHIRASAPVLKLKKEVDDGEGSREGGVKEGGEQHGSHAHHRKSMSSGSVLDNNSHVSHHQNDKEEAHSTMTKRFASVIQDLPEVNKYAKLTASRILSSSSSLSSYTSMLVSHMQEEGNNSGNEMHTEGTGCALTHDMKQMSLLKQPQQTGTDFARIPQDCTIQGLVHFELGHLYEIGRLAQLNEMIQGLQSPVNELAAGEEKEKQKQNPDPSSSSSSSSSSPSSSSSAQVEGEDLEKLKFNERAAVFHYTKAAEEGHIEGMLLLARLYATPPITPTQMRDHCPHLNLHNPTLAYQWVEAAAERGLREGRVWAGWAAAAAPDLEGGGPGGLAVPGGAPDFPRAIRHLRLALGISASPSETKKEENEETEEEEVVEAEEGDGESDGDSSNKKKKKADIDLHGWEVTCSRYELMASLAKLYGEEELPDSVPMPDGTTLTLPDYVQAAELYREAADEAMAEGKGKLSLKFYEQAELYESM